jgi:CHAT domain
MASTPSMSWLWAARRSSPSQRERRKAWISTDSEEGKSAALSMVADRLRDCFSEHRIDLNTSASLPDDLCGAELVVIAGHGGILPEGRIIQRVSDDSNLSMYPATLASALNSTSIVILFVCSGGRIDAHPIGETTVGLVKELLNEGCSTVIASPWPLNVSVPPNWLPVFMREWVAGKTPIEATFLANKHVAKSLGESPVDYLAMNVFGDPLRSHQVTANK